MEKKIPIYFDTIVLDSPIQEISLNGSNDQGSRLKVAVFTKYKNRNGSYITDEYADTLINSATRGDTPVVGFFDPETQEWASHTGPTLANGYGYVESFLGWEPFTDTDGITRDYAVFSVVLFTKYYEEANKIRGQHQSMELNPETIQGDWANFDGVDYFVYTAGEMLGLCVIGSHEPCFSVSSFFSKNDDTYKTQYEKFTSILSSLKDELERIKSTTKGGEQPMDEFENKEVVETEIVAETPADEEPSAEVTSFEEASVEVEDENPVEEVETEVDEPAAEPEVEAVEEPSEFELLQQQYNELKAAYDSLNDEYEAAKVTLSNYETVNADLTSQISQNTEKIQELEESLQNYTIKVELEKKEALIEKYEKILNEEEITAFKSMINDLSYDELESKLAITFANAKITDSENLELKIPLPEQKETEFALLMKKYRKN